MVLLDMKSTNGSSSSSPLNLSTSKDKPATSFSELLKGASDAKDKKTVQNGSLALARSHDDKNVITPKASAKVATLSSLMQSQDAKVEKKEKEPLELNPKLVSTLSTVEVKTLINDAKNYLKSKIQESDGYKKSEMKELPTTLKGLVEVAKKFGIDISKISLQEVKEHALGKADVLKQDSVLKTETPKEIPQENRDLKAQSSKDAKQATKDSIQDKKSQHNEIQKQTQTAHNEASKAEHNGIKSDDKQSEIQKEIKATPLFKAQSVTEHATTEQIVQAKVNSTVHKSEHKTPKEKADETLKLLLNGEKISRDTSVATTPDFSLNIAKVIAPNLTADNTKSLEKLLQGDSFVSESSSLSAKVDSLGVSKADSFEVKINEAKQMIKYLSDDIKNAINDYKAPFTRIKVQLNPQHLGEVDLTVIQRGKNLHVNISSNNAAINTLSMNINELRVQLNNSGINSATFNFNSSSQNGDNSSASSQQQRQHEQKAHSEYSHFENEEAHEEIISSLEIIVPRYI